MERLQRTEFTATSERSIRVGVTVFPTREKMLQTEVVDQNEKVIVIVIG